MPATLGNANLRNLGPTPEELVAAKELLAKATPAQQRSKMASMVQWLKANPDSVASSSRGSERAEYLQAFVIHQLRAKTTAKRSEHTAEKSQEKRVIDKKRFWNREKMDLELGPIKGEAIRSMPGAKCRPCRYTGSESDDLKEWLILSDEEEEVGVDRNGWTVKAEGEAGEADMKLLSEMSATASSSKFNQQQTPPLQPQVKTEKASADEIAAKEYQEFLGTVKEQHTTFSKMQVEMGDLDQQLARMKYTDELRSALKKHTCRLSSLVKVLLRACRDKPLPKEYPKLRNAMAHVMKSQQEFVRMAASFGVVSKSSKRRRVTIE